MFISSNTGMGSYAQQSELNQYVAVVMKQVQAMQASSLRTQLLGEMQRIDASVRQMDRYMDWHKSPLLFQNQYNNYMQALITIKRKVEEASGVRIYTPVSPVSVGSGEDKPVSTSTDWNRPNVRVNDVLQITETPGGRNSALLIGAGVVAVFAAIYLFKKGR